MESHSLSHRDALVSALKFLGHIGVDESVESLPQDRTAFVPPPLPDRLPAPQRGFSEKTDGSPPLSGHTYTPPGRSENALKAASLAARAETLDDLRTALAGFDGISLKETATRLVFSDGNPHASVMLVGEAPGADEDRQGKPFVGVSGQLLDKILLAAGLSRGSSDPASAIYISNILNWRPPGNRTPSPAEIEASLPFIERHIVLACPKLLILCGGVSANALLGHVDKIGRLRGRWHLWKPLTPGISPPDFPPIPALATYHPSFLLRTPDQKRAVWSDMCLLMKKSEEMGLRTIQPAKSS